MNIVMGELAGKNDRYINMLDNDSQCVAFSLCIDFSVKGGKKASVLRYSPLNKALN